MRIKELWCAEWSLDREKKNHFKCSTLESIVEVNLDHFNRGICLNWTIVFVSEDKKQVLEFLGRHDPYIEEEE